eukprot:m.1642172 g.1642172  ORF g.1642172 m.1642172 type:complete len:51 (-) comp51758_c0_seq1:90-242(-)
MNMFSYSHKKVSIAQFDPTNVKCADCISVVLTQNAQCFSCDNASILHTYP